jgi:hypothetical protein
MQAALQADFAAMRAELNSMRQADQERQQQLDARAAAVQAANE